LQGETESATAALERGERPESEFSPAMIALLGFAEKLTLTPSEMTAADVAAVRQAGWTDPQLAEAVYVISLFAFFNRVADAFGLGEWTMGGTEEAG